VQRRDLPGGQHDQDRQDGDAVHQRLADSRPTDRHWDITPRIGHLLRSGRGQFDPDKRVQQNGDDGDEHRRRGAEIASRDAVHPVPRAVEEDTEREERQQHHLPHRAAGGNPLAQPQRDDRSNRGQPDEHGPEQIHPGQR
jgi:hypothetical protein